MLERLAYFGGPHDGGHCSTASRFPHGHQLTVHVPVKAGEGIGLRPVGRYVVERLAPNFAFLRWEQAQ